MLCGRVADQVEMADRRSRDGDRRELAEFGCTPPKVTVADAYD